MQVNSSMAQIHKKHVKQKRLDTKSPLKKIGLKWARKLRTGWLQIRPVLFFVLGFVILTGLFYALWLSDFFCKNIHPRILSVNAWLAGHLLNVFGQHVRFSGEMIFSPSFSISIARGCDAIEAMALFAAALLAFPARWKPKLIGMAGGIAALFLLNIIRIVTLFLTGLHFPKAFDIMHTEVWQALFLFLAVGLWIFVIQRAMRGKHETAN